MKVGAQNLIPMCFPICLALALAGGGFEGALAAQTVPFVGCPGDGQTGPVEPVKGAPKRVALDAATASALAYYQAGDAYGVLAPRGWNCFFVYGSDGQSLMVAPNEKFADALDASFTGPAVIGTLHYGSTSGRFAVAKYAARLFPKQARAFIASVIAEGIEPKSEFIFQPYPADHVTPKGARSLVFETPAGAEGLGTSDRLKPGDLPVTGFAALQGDRKAPDFFLLTVRLPADEAGLAPAIVSGGR